MVRLDMKEHFCTVLMELCTTQNLADISASDVIRASYTARQTFYNHFDDIDDLICYAATRGLFTGQYPFSDPRNTRHAYEYALEHRAFFEQLPRHSGQNNFRNAYNAWLKQYCEREFIDESLDEHERRRRRIAAELFIAGSTEVLLNWYATGMETPIDDIMEVLLAATPPFMLERIDKTPTQLPNYPK